MENRHWPMSVKLIFADMAQTKNFQKLNFDSCCQEKLKKPPYEHHRVSNTIVAMYSSLQCKMTVTSYTLHRANCTWMH